MSDRTRGILYLFLSMLFFSVTTIIVKIAASYYMVPAVQISFSRFVVGLVLTLVVLAFRHHTLRPVKLHILFLRGVSNAIAVILFFLSIDLAGVTKGNLYNMTYPVYVAVIAHFFLRERLTIHKVLALAGALAGIWMVSGAGTVHFTFGAGDLAGIASGFTAGIAIVILRTARFTEESLTIVFFVMLTGTLFNGLAFFNHFVRPDAVQLLLLILVGFLSFLGQIAITYGYRYIDALPGAIISTLRIIVAPVLAVILLGEYITLPVVLGGFLIFISVVGVSYFGSVQRS